MPFSASHCITEITNAIAITAVARPPDTALGRRRPTAALTRKPANGRSGISASTRSPFQRREGFGVERFTMSEQTDHEREAHRSFGRGDGHDEERDDLAIDFAELAAERNERQVDGV